MSQTAKRAKLLSDFDGTAVKKYGWYSPRNWSKYPLHGISGYLDFIVGAQEEGVEFAGVPTVRKKFWRQRFTNWSIRDLGYMGVIDPSMVKYAGNEEAKGQFVVEQSLEGTVGIIDDNPQKIGKAMLSNLLARDIRLDDSPSLIIVGAVGHSCAHERVEELAASAERLGGQVEAHAHEGDPELRVTGEGFRMDVVQLPAYSVEAGRQFAQRLMAG